MPRIPTKLQCFWLIFHFKILQYIHFQLIFAHIQTAQLIQEHGRVARRNWANPDYGTAKIRTDLREHGPLIFRDQKVLRTISYIIDFQHCPYLLLFLKYPLKSSSKISPDVPIFLHFYRIKLVIPSPTQVEGMMTQLELMHCTMAYEPGCWADRKGVWSGWPSYLSINYSVNGACL